MGCPCFPEKKEPKTKVVPVDEKEKAPTTVQPGKDAPSAGDWWQAPLSGTVKRCELRSMPPALQRRYAAAVLKMRENTKGPGTSEYFRLAVYHGGLPELPGEDYPEYCVHGQEAFPTWHRPYMLDFERAMRRADISLGGDGAFGLPYWDWSVVEVNGEVLPKVVRDKLMGDFPPDFFPDERAAGVCDTSKRLALIQTTLRYHEARKKMNPRWRFDPSLKCNSDAHLKAKLGRGSVAAVADKCLRSTYHAQHACTSWATSSQPSVESCHNSMHMYVGGVMGSFQSSFHPIFWLHHCNVDRLYESYLKLEPDSAAEFEAHQKERKAKGDMKAAEGFPEGPWGSHRPFKHPATGEPFHARDCYDIGALGFSYDVLASPRPPQLREQPYYAVFPQIDVTKVEEPCSVHVFVAKKGEAFTPPAAADESTLLGSTGYAGAADVFFLNNPAGCPNCAKRPPFDEYVDVTQALRTASLHPDDAAFHCVVAFPIALGAKGTLPLAEVAGLPAPVMKGPRFADMGGLLAEGAAGGDVDAALELLGLPKGPLDAAAVEKLKAAQKASGIKEDGVLGPRTKVALLQMLNNDAVVTPESDDGNCGGATWTASEEIPWTIDEKTLPPSLPAASLEKACAAQLAKWGAATGLAFVKSDAAPKLTISFADHSKGNEYAFDGPGGMLAHCTPSTIVFDKAEYWELGGVAHPRRATYGVGEADFWDPFYALEPVLLHEAGHFLGLGHSEDPASVMAPYYNKAKLELTEGDITAAKALVV